MTAEIIDGKTLSRTIQAEIRDEVARFTADGGAPPKLVAILVGEDPASQVYVRNKERACERVGIASELKRLPATTTTSELLGLIADLNADPEVSGILVQLPLPPEIDSVRVLDAVDPGKDVDAFHPLNVGLISQGRPQFLPCTPHGVLQMLARYDVPTAGKKVVVIGRSDIVGKPMTLMLANKDIGLGPDFANATVTLCHSRTRNLAEEVRQAEIVIAAIGRPKFVTADMIRPGATVIDVGINRTDEGLVGDVDYGPVAEVAAKITPVPGGVGPLTVTMLLQNTLTAAKLASQK